MSNKRAPWTLATAAALAWMAGVAHAQQAAPGGPATNQTQTEQTAPSPNTTTPDSSTISPPGPSGTGRLSDPSLATGGDSQTGVSAPGTTAPGAGAQVQPPATAAPAPESVLTPPVVETEVESQTENTFERWLPWIVAAVALLGVLLFLATRQKGGQVIAATKGGETASRRDEPNQR